MFPATTEANERPSSLTEALALHAHHREGEAIFLAADKSAMQANKSRKLWPRCIVDLRETAKLKGISECNDLAVGATVRSTTNASNLGNAHYGIK